MNLIRSILFVIWLYGGMVVIGTLFLPTLLLPGRITSWAAITWAHQVRFGLRWICGVKTDIRGRENLPGEPCLIAGKHQAMYDVLIPFILRGTRPVIVLKKELLWYPIFGWYAIRLGCIPIDRSAGASALKDMVARARKRLDEGRDILIFPEGTRQNPGTPPDYKPGAAALYNALNVPCALIATNAGLCWPAKGLKRRKGTVVYQILPPIEPGLNRKVFAPRMQDAIESASNELLIEGLKAQGRTANDL